MDNPNPLAWMDKAQDEHERALQEKAWDEGYRQGQTDYERVVVDANGLHVEPPTPNPYRKEKP